MEKSKIYVCGKQRRTLMEVGRTLTRFHLGSERRLVILKQIFEKKSIHFKKYVRTLEGNIIGTAFD